MKTVHMRFLIILPLQSIHSPSPSRDVIDLISLRDGQRRMYNGAQLPLSKSKDGKTANLVRGICSTYYRASSDSVIMNDICFYFCCLPRIPQPMGVQWEAHPLPINLYPSQRLRQNQSLEIMEHHPWGRGGAPQIWMGTVQYTSIPKFSRGFGTQTQQRLRKLMSSCFGSTEVAH